MRGGDGRRARPCGQGRIEPGGEQGAYTITIHGRLAAMLGAAGISEEIEIPQRVNQGTVRLVAAEGFEPPTKGL